MFNRTERLYLLYAETQGFINPEQASNAEVALLTARESGQEFTPWDLLKDWQYLSPEQTSELYNAVERAVAKCERHPLVVSGSPTAETTEYPVVGDPFDVPTDPHPVMPAVPSLPPTPATGTPAIHVTEPVSLPEPDTVSPILDDTPTPRFHYVTPPETKLEVSPSELETPEEVLEIPSLTSSTDEKQESAEPETKPSLAIPSLVPQEEKQEDAEPEPKPDPEQKKKTKIRKKKKTKTETTKKEETKPNPVVDTGDQTELAPAAEEKKPLVSSGEMPARETPPAEDHTASETKPEEKAEETTADSKETEAFESKTTTAASETTEPAEPPASPLDETAKTRPVDEKQPKTPKLETTITSRSRTRAAEAQSEGSASAVAAAIAAIVVLGGGVYFLAMNSNEVKPKRLKMAKAKIAQKKLAKKAEIDAIFGAGKNRRRPIGGRGESTNVRATAADIITDKQETGKTVKAKQLASATVNQQKQRKPDQAGDSTKPEQKNPAKTVAQLEKEMKDLEDFLGPESVWLGNETFKGKHDGEKSIFNIYKGSPVPEEGMINGARIFTNAPEGTAGSLFLLRKLGDKLQVIKHAKFSLDWESKDYVRVEGLNWKVKKGDLLAHWGIAPARKEADTSDECYVLAKEPGKDEKISLTGLKKLPRRLYALQAEFVVPEPEEKKK